MPMLAVTNEAADRFALPLTEPARRRRRRRTIATALVAALIASASVWAVRQVAVHSCRGFAWPDTALSRVDGECIGWANEKAFAYMPALKDITDKIAAENRSVRRRGEGTGGQQKMPYVRIAVFMPLTSRDATNSLSLRLIRHSLQGVYVAQRRANHGQDLVATIPLIQLLLVNIGRDQTHWQVMADELADMTDGDHPVVAAVGLGVSLHSTQDAAEALDKHGIPTIGAVLTATNLDTPRLFKVSPSNAHYIAALADFLDRQSTMSTAALFFDTTKGDIYVQTLREAFEERLRTRFGERTFEFKGSREHTGEVTDFSYGRNHVVCPNQVDMVFFAGRDRDLPNLIASLASRDVCGHTKPIAVLTGATGLGSIQQNPDLHAVLHQKRIRIIEASSTHARQWLAGVDAPAGFAGFRAEYFEHFGDAADLDDGYAIMHHDSVVAAVWAARQAVQGRGGYVPNAVAVYTAIKNLHGKLNSVRAASGDLTFDDGSHGWPHGKKVPILQIPDGPPVVPAYTTP